MCAQYVLAEKRRTGKRRLSTAVGLRETRMVSEGCKQIGMQ